MKYDEQTLRQRLGRLKKMNPDELARMYLRLERATWEGLNAMGVMDAHCARICIEIKILIERQALK